MGPGNGIFVSCTRGAPPISPVPKDTLTHTELVELIGVKRQSVACLEIAEVHMRVAKALQLEARMWLDLSRSFDEPRAITGTEFFTQYFDKVLRSVPLTTEQERLLRIACVNELHTALDPFKIPV